jgi:transposase
LSKLVEHATRVDMYLRTTQRKNKDGSVVRYLHLAHNVRDPETGTSVPYNIHNFGRADELDREVLIRLCGSIARACGVDVHGPAETGDPTLTDKAGLPDDLKLIRTIELGTVMVIEALWEKLGIGGALRAAADRCGCRVPYERALLAMTANRLCEPESKLGVWDRWLEKVYLPTCQGLKLAQMYEAMDLLHKHSATIEERVFFETANLFNLEVDVIFYDTTTATFSIDEEDEDDGDDEGLRRFGRPKEGGWAPQVMVALAVTRDGLPVRSWVFPGNTSDVTTVQRVKSDLKGWKLGRALFVADSGMNSEESRMELAKACGTYLLAARAGSVKEIRDVVLARPGRYKVVSDNLQAKEVVVGEGVRRRRYILCYNPKQAERERTHREQVVGQLEEEVGRHRDRKATAQWAIELKASKRFGRYLRITKGGKVEIDRAAIREAERFDGKWVVQTNDDTITAEDAAAGYKALLVIERCFRSLKRTQLKMSPMWHWLPRRIEAHVKICVLALLLERVAERTLGQPWARIRGCLAGIQASYFETESHGFVERNEPTPEHVSTLKSLAIPMPRKVLEVSARS